MASEMRPTPTLDEASARVALNDKKWAVLKYDLLDEASARMALNDKKWVEELLSMDGYAAVYPTLVRAAALP